MNPRVYVETTIPSYLAARPSGDLVVAGHQHITRQWWDRRRASFDLAVSSAVVDECSRGDPVYAAVRLELIRGLPVLAVTDAVLALAEELMRGAGLPDQARFDAVHVAAAVMHGMDYRLTWNCKHIANAALVPRFDAICRRTGFALPLICTPEWLLED
jgi:hypothetical protein